MSMPLMSDHLHIDFFFFFRTGGSVSSVGGRGGRLRLYGQYVDVSELPGGNLKKLGGISGCVCGGRGLNE